MAAKLYTRWVNSLKSLPLVPLHKHTKKVQKHFAMLDGYSQKDYKKNYSNLTEIQRTRLHENINTGVYLEKT